MVVQILPLVMDWGWTEKCEVSWITLPEASKALTILKHCGCKKGCKGWCLCRMLELLEHGAVQVQWQGRIACEIPWLLMFKKTFAMGVFFNSTEMLFTLICSYVM